MSLLNKFFIFDIWFDSRKMHDGFDSHNGHNSHDKFNTSGQARKAIQTYGLQVSSIRDSVLKDKNVPVTVSAKCLYHTDVSFLNSTTELPKHTGINNHSINLVDDKQPSYALLSRPLLLRTFFICKMDGSL